MLKADGFTQRPNGDLRRDDDRVTVSLLHFADGWRWWVHSRPNHYDVGDPGGYVSLADALEVARAYAGEG